jgi:hypothetical protein
MSNLTASSKMLDNNILYPISFIIEKYKVCKICGAENVFRITKSKELKNPRGTTDIFLVKDGKIHITEEGPYKIWISDAILDMKDNSYSINAVKGYTFDKIIINLILGCGDCESKRGPKTVSPYPALPDDDCEETYGIDYRSHYEAGFLIEIDQDTKKVLECKLNKEVLDNGEFIIHKHIQSNSTRIIKKQKLVRLPFIYDKDFTEFDFNKLLTISSLLK